MRGGEGKSLIRRPIASIELEPLVRQCYLVEKDHCKDQERKKVEVDLVFANTRERGDSSAELAGGSPS